MPSPDGEDHEHQDPEPHELAVPQAQGGGKGPSDVFLDVPALHVDELDLEVEDLEAHVSLQAEVLDLLKLNVGADVRLGRVTLGIEGVDVQAQLRVRLHNIAVIVTRLLTTVDRNPQILEQLTKGAAAAVENVGAGTSRAVGELGEGAGTAVGEVGRSAGAAVESVGDSAGTAVEDVGDRTGAAVDEASHIAADTAGGPAPGDFGESAAGDEEAQRDEGRDTGARTEPRPARRRSPRPAGGTTKRGGKKRSGGAGEARSGKEPAAETTAAGGRADHATKAAPKKSASAKAAAEKPTSAKAAPKKTVPRKAAPKKATPEKRAAAKPSAKKARSVASRSAGTAEGQAAAGRTRRRTQPFPDA
ncbi:hypothetical protein ABZ802_32875 [Streptomyces sp. NPDC047737]|uniref:hypothetical protein n=1 Tax=Streptomyces sp. NPDC047737 TaxID=3155740 RepID=UPI0033E2D665